MDIKADMTSMIAKFTAGDAGWDHCKNRQEKKIDEILGWCLHYSNRERVQLIESLFQFNMHNWFIKVCKEMAIFS